MPNHFCAPITLKIWGLIIEKSYDEFMTMNS